MKITIVNPGLIPIDLTSEDNRGWGAVEKMILNVTKNLIKRGHIVQIKEISDIAPDVQDIVWVHFANQALELARKGIQYIFHFHDHNICLLNQDSQAVKDNFLAVEKSILTLVPAEFLINYFKNPYKCHYFGHGCNIDYFIPYPSKKKELLLIAHNGYSFNPAADRKGFEIAIKVARKLNLPITIAGPSKNNKPFFENNKELVSYTDQLTIKYDLNEKELLHELQTHSCFINPSEIEAGQPNLTLLESLACGVPVVATYTGRHIPGIIKASRDVDSFVSGVEKVMANYHTLSTEARRSAEANSYQIVAARFEKVCDSILNVKNFNTIDSFKEKLISLYQTTEIKQRAPKPVPENEFNINFINGAFVEIVGVKDAQYHVEFRDRDKDQLLFETKIKTNNWARAKFEYLINYDIRVKDLSGKLIHRHIFKPADKNVYIAFESAAIGDTCAFMPYVEEFRKKYQCKVYLSTFHNSLFASEYPETTFVNPGETINDLYAMYKVGIYWSENDVTFDRFRHPSDPRSIPLQKVAADILGIDFKEIPAKIKVNNPARLIQDKYVTLSTKGTALCKHYHGGWQEIVDFINQSGYKVVLVQKESDTELLNVINPKNKDIQTSLNYLLNGEFHISISTGTAWLANALDKKVVLVSGITKEFNEFKNNVIQIRPDNSVCNGCFNDNSLSFGSEAKGDWEYCPRYKGTNRQFECTKSIRPRDIINKIKDILIV